MASFQGLSEKSMLSILSIFLICTSTCQVCFSAVGPDLVVVDFWELNHLVYFQIRNIGDEPAQAGHATTLYVDGQQTDQVYVTSALAPGKDYNGVFPKYYWQCGQGQHVLLVFADSKYLVKESNEQNNTRLEIWNCDTTPPQILTGPTVSNITNFYELRA